MKIFYFILFGAAGVFNILAAALDWKWYIDYWTYQHGRPRQRIKSRRVLRFFIGFSGALLIVFGTAVLIGWI